jgi:CTP synthase
MKKYIFITGGVLSSLGKGITAGSIGALLEAKGLSISLLKLDPYLNPDPGTMNPYQHGEVFVTDDGAETDLDLGHYERFTSATLTKNNSATAGKFYSQLLDKERKGVYLGQTIQTIPHFTNEIKEYVNNASADADVTIVEIGGTIGDIEGLPFIEAIRQIHLDRKNTRCAFVHVTYIPYITVADELKTKPTQHSVKVLLSLGIQPDVIVGRAEKPLPNDIKKKLALFTNVDESAIISAPDLKSVYEAPLAFYEQNLDGVLSDLLGLSPQRPDLAKWRVIVDQLYAQRPQVKIALVGKYVELRDAYKSIYESLVHAQIPNNVKIIVEWIDAEQITPETVTSRLSNVDAILVPGGFGDRGIDGKIEAIKYARENNIPFLGICLGMQVAVIEFARNVLNLKDANSTEFNPATTYPIIDLMIDQKDKIDMGGTLRLGAYDCALAPDSLARSIYGKEIISERHRHRYEFNTAFADQCKEHGLLVTGIYKQQNLPEIVEIPSHPFFIACQFHPEFKSKPFASHPLFVSFVEAAKEYKENRTV